MQRLFALQRDYNRALPGHLSARSRFVMKTPDSPLSDRVGDAIVIHGARQNNLKNLTLAIPTSELVVVTGVSGSGKSSLVFDTL